jgi:hypothetical protein
MSQDSTSICNFLIDKLESGTLGKLSEIEILVFTLLCDKENFLKISSIISSSLKNGILHFPISYEQWELSPNESFPLINHSQVPHFSDQLSDNVHLTEDNLNPNLHNQNDEDIEHNQQLNFQLSPTQNELQKLKFQLSEPQNKYEQSLNQLHKEIQEKEKENKQLNNQIHQLNLHLSINKSKLKKF